jgi:hypothetical protein
MKALAFGLLTAVHEAEDNRQPRAIISDFTNAVILVTAVDVAK